MRRDCYIRRAFSQRAAKQLQYTVQPLSHGFRSSTLQLGFSLIFGVQMKFEHGKYLIYQCILIFHFDQPTFVMLQNFGTFTFLIQILFFFSFHFDLFDLNDETFVNFLQGC